MANNVFGSRANAVVCHTAVNFADIPGFDVDAVSIVYLIDAVNKSWKPDRDINGITGFVAEKGYYMVMKTDMDLTAYLVPPTSGGVTPPDDSFADFDFTTLNNIHEIPTNIWEATGTAGSYGYTGLAAIKLAAGDDGAIISHITDSSAQSAVLGFAATNALTTYATMKAAIWVVSGVVSCVDNGTVTDPSATVSYGDWLGVFRTGSVLKIRKSSDNKATWTDLFTFTFSSAADLFAVVDIYGDTVAPGKLVTPQQTGLS